MAGFVTQRSSIHRATPLLHLTFVYMTQEPSWSCTEFKARRPAVKEPTSRSQRNRFSWESPGGGRVSEPSVKQWKTSIGRNHTYTLWLSHRLLPAPEAVPSSTTLRRITQAQADLPCSPSEQGVSGGKRQKGQVGRNLTPPTHTHTRGFSSACSIHQGSWLL